MRKETFVQARLEGATHAAVEAVEAARAHTGHAVGSARLAAEHLKDAAVTTATRRTAGSLTARAKPSSAGRRRPVVLGAVATAAFTLAVWRLARDAGR